MANFVNPPFLKIPPELFKDRVTRAFFEQQNTIIFQLWRKLGGNNDPIDDLTNSSSNGNSSQVQWMQRQISGLPDFTVDTSGFTIDTSLITTDKAVA
tara:strand:- start:675 stop:965 length:291 start_codon:yes stop_codon:yes gene_type:complete